MKRVNLLVTDQSLSESKMTTTGQASHTGSTRTKAFKGLLSHFMFLAGLLLITLLTSGKAYAEVYSHTITLATNEETCHISIVQTGEKTATLTASSGYTLPETFTGVDMNSGTALTSGAGSVNYTYSDGTFTVADGTEVTGNIVITATAMSANATLTTLQYALGEGGATDVSSEFTSEEFEYNVVAETYTKEVTVTLSGTPTTGATITTPEGATITKQEDGTKAATATIEVTAEDGKTKQTYTVSFTFPKDKLSTITPPSVSAFTARNVDEATALAALKEQASTVAITTVSGEEADPLAIEWSYNAEKNASQAYNNAAGKSNSFTWTATVRATLDDNGVTPTNEVSVANAAASTDNTLSALTYKIGTEGASEDITIGNQEGANIAITVPALPFGTTDITLLATPTDPFATVTKVEESTGPDPKAIEIETFSFPVTVNAEGNTEFKLKVTAEDNSTEKVFTLIFSVGKDKINKVVVPETYKLPETADNKDVAIALLEKMEGVTITTIGGAAMKLKWEYNKSDNGTQEYNNAAGKTNIFAWSVVRDGDGGALEGAESVEITGKTTVSNFIQPITGDQSSEDVKVTTDKPIDKIGDGTIATTVNSVEIAAEVTTDLLTINNAEIKEKLDLQGSVDEIVLNKAIIPEVILAATKTTTLTLQSGNKIDKITNAGTLTLQKSVSSSVVAALSMAVETRAALTNNGEVKAVDNNGTFTDETATIVVVGGKADLSITEQPKGQTTYGDNVTLTVAATSSADIAYKWQKYSGGWVDASVTEASLKVEKVNGSTDYRCEVKSSKEGAITTLYTPAVTVTFLTESIPDEPSNPTTPTYTVSLDKVTGATFSKGETTTVDEGDDFSFKITLDKDYDQSKPVVTVDGKAITADADGNYTIENIQKDIKIIVLGIVKNTATGIEDTVEDAARAWTIGSTLYIHVPEIADVYVVSGTGALQQQLRGVSGDYNMQLRAGFYIVRIGEVSQKVIIR